jgi:hypothetical protein
MREAGAGFNSLTARGGTGRGRWRGGGRSRSRPAAGAPPRTGTATPVRPRPESPPRRIPTPSAPRIAPPHSSSPPGALVALGRAGARPAVERVLCLRSKRTKGKREHIEICWEMGVLEFGPLGTSCGPLGFQILYGLQYVHVLKACMTFSWATCEAEILRCVCTREANRPIFLAKELSLFLMEDFISLFFKNVISSKIF